MHVTSRREWRRKPLFAAFAALAVVGALGISGIAHADDGGVSDAPILGIWEAQSLNGINNNPNFPTIGSAGTRYLRIGPANYADGKSQMIGGPNARNVSNREFNDTNINVFSERGVTQWGNIWGQFLDHNVGHRDENGTLANIPYNNGTTDPLETFTNTLGYIPFNRSAAAPGTGVTNTRQHINTETAFIDAEAVYGASDTRLDWLRTGSLDGNPDNNSGSLMMSGSGLTSYLPAASARGNVSAAPTMAVDGRLLSHPQDAKIAGDVRANEQFGLTAVQTLWAREHNRIVNSLPSWVSQEDKFQLARAVVLAEIQYITYNEFLPAMGVTLPAYQGYNDFLDPSTSHEFATVGYRAHSFIHGEVETTTNTSRYSQTTLNALAAQGVEVVPNGASTTIAVPLNVGFFNPGLVEQIQLGPIMSGITGESDYRNDEMIDNSLRSVLFRIPSSSNPDCLDGPTMPTCFNSVADLGAIDLQRGRDHGMPLYNAMRNAYGLSSKTSFTAVTGESTDVFPAGLNVNSPSCMDIIQLFDINGNPTTVAADNATRVVKRCTLAARLKAIYGTPSNMDAFVGMLAEKHLSGKEMGELQNAIWVDQFGAARDGDRFFYANDPLQDYIRQNFGIDSRVSLAQILSRNTDFAATGNVFRLPGAPNVGAGFASGSSTASTDSTTATAPTAAVTPSALTRHDKNTPTKTNTKTGPQSAIAPNNTGPRALRRRHRRRSSAHE